MCACGPGQAGNGKKVTRYGTSSGLLPERDSPEAGSTGAMMKCSVRRGSGGQALPGASLSVNNLLSAAPPVQVAFRPTAVRRSPGPEQDAEDCVRGFDTGQLVGCLRSRRDCESAVWKQAVIILAESKEVWQGACDAFCHPRCCVARPRGGA